MIGPRPRPVGIAPSTDRNGATPSTPTCASQPRDRPARTRPAARSITGAGDRRSAPVPTSGVLEDEGFEPRRRRHVPARARSAARCDRRSPGAGDRRGQRPRDRRRDAARGRPDAYRRLQRHVLHPRAPRRGPEPGERAAARHARRPGPRPATCCSRGARSTADEAAAVGLVNGAPRRARSRAELAAEVAELAPLTVQGHKRASTSSPARGRDRSRRDAGASRLRFASQDLREGLAALTEKRARASRGASGVQLPDQRAGSRRTLPESPRG